jgi:GT2 family glycosyltransferase
MRAGTDPPPLVSVVVPTADRCELVVACVEHLLRQEYASDRYELIVVDDGSRDATPVRIRTLRAGHSETVIRYLRQPGRGPGAARNAGLELARGELICFLDDDALAPPQWLTAVVEGAARHPDAGCLGGPVRPRFERRPPPTCAVHELAGTRLDHGTADTEVDEVWGCNMTVRRAAFRTTGPFDERLAVAEDWDWGRRLRAAQGRIVYLPEAWVWHRRLRSDLKVPGLILEYYRRGYVVGTRGEARTADDPFAAAIESLRHARRERCTRGLTDSARSLGQWAGGLARRGGRLPRSHRLG